MGQTKIVSKVLIKITAALARPTLDAKGGRPSRFSIFFSSWRRQEESERIKNQLDLYSRLLFCSSNHSFIEHRLKEFLCVKDFSHFRDLHDWSSKFSF